ncbi:MAG TPA: class III extradiol ring-cleavage dioxygenase [Vicinamibacterales bacterium]|nr:class III extradiol ring-cleavage dioxygenase [Vicinamibacterales bacterium]
MNSGRLPTYFVSHGGGPWPWMTGPFRRQFDRLAASLDDVAREVGGEVRAVLAVSGHWEAARFTVQSAEHPGMVYDYGGFPPELYRITFPSAGAPDVANRVRDLLTHAGIDAALDPTRGYDHGVFAPLKAMYPDANVPVLQLSLKRGLDPAEHLAAGRALAPLRDEGIVVLGSGLSWHNLQLFGPAARESSQAFDRWLDEALSQPPAQRTRRLIEWERAPAARLSHPDADHLLPLMVAVGAAEQERAVRVYHEEQFMGGVTASSYRFGDVRQPV